MIDHYAVLGIPADAPIPAVRAAFRRRIKEVHPDTSSGRRDEGTADEVTRITAAYDVLSDPQRRAAYDAARAPGRSTAPRAAGSGAPAARTPGRSTAPRAAGTVRRPAVPRAGTAARRGRTVMMAIAMVAVTLVVGSLVVAGIVAVGGRGPDPARPTTGWAVGNCVVLEPPVRPVPCAGPHDARILAAQVSADRCAAPADLYALVDGRAWCLARNVPGR